MVFLPTSTMGTEFLRLSDIAGTDGTVVGADEVSTLTGDRPDRRMLFYSVSVRALPAPARSQTCARSRIFY